MMPDRVSYTGIRAVPKQKAGHLEMAIVATDVQCSVASLHTTQEIATCIDGRASTKHEVVYIEWSRPQ